MTLIGNKFAHLLLPLLAVLAAELIAGVQPLECYSCDAATDSRCSVSQNVTAAQLQSCPPPATNQFEACYTYRHPSNGTVSRGCLLDATPAILGTCTGDPSNDCVLCTEDGCNEHTAELEVCIECDSEVDASCARLSNGTQQEQLVLDGVACPLSYNGQVGCYRYELNGHIKRGCASRLSAAEADTCQSTDTCKRCHGSRCNAKVDFQQCRSCRSTETSQCVRSPGSVPSVLCAAYDDVCVTHVRDDVVVRGCLAEIGDEQRDQVRADCGAVTDEGHCVRCSGAANCNGRKVDGEFCVHCDSDTDAGCADPAANGTAVLAHIQCRLAVSPLGCYLFADGGDIVKRGCVGDLVDDEQRMCREEGDYCKTCRGNDCNARTAFQRCHTCSSATAGGLNCIRSPQSYAAQLCGQYDDECVTHVRNDVVTRGCRAELSETVGTALQVDCDGGAATSDWCARCSGPSGCNRDVVDGEFCMACDSATDENCVAQLTHTMRVQCPLGVRQRGCYREEEEVASNGTAALTVRRGCVAQLPAAAVEQCRLGAAGCKACIGNDCNAKPAFQRCRRCSSLDSVNCIRSPNAFASVTCSAYTDACFVHVRDDIVTRGCAGEHLPALANATASECAGPECTTCASADNCNDGLVDGEFCMECDTRIDGDACRRELNHTMRKQCPLAATQRGCYLFDDGGVNDGGNVRRGCVADLGAGEAAECEAQGDTCKTCAGNDCNAKARFQRCRVCNSTEDVTCVRSANSILSQQCDHYEDECYALVVGNVVTRGCVRQAPVAVQATCATRPELCETCAPSICNGGLVDGEFCMTCDSTADANCVSAVNVTMRTQCSLSVQPRGCYRWSDGEGGGGVVRRGCVADLEAAGQECTDDGARQQCKECMGNDCNAKVDFEWCKTCNSTENVDCIRYVKNYIAAEQCAGYDDRCFTHVSGNVTVRGCAGEWPALAADCQANPELCEVCSGGGPAACNDRIVDGEFCVTCDSNVNAECRDILAVVDLRTQCSLSVAPLGCYDRRNATANRVQRGCISDLPLVEQRACKSAGGGGGGGGGSGGGDTTCQVCVGNECNVRAQLAECVVCDSAADEDCVRMGQPERRVETCADYADRCYTRIVGDRVWRGCVGQLPTAEQLCTDGDESCLVCDGAGCNRLSVEPEFCMVCSDSDPMCGSMHLQACGRSANATQSLSLERRGCYHEIDQMAGRVERGCLSALDEERQLHCSQQLGCKTCIDADGCNKRADFQRCYACDSLMDPRCVEAISAYMDPIACLPYEDTCTQMVLADGLTRRGCSSQLAAEGVPDGPKIVQQEECAQSGCNGAVFPADRRRCHRCAGVECSGELTEASVTFRVCPEYLEEDFCYGLLDANDGMIRGCHSDQSDEKQHCYTAGSACLLCDHADGCNNQADRRAAQLSCVQCSEADANCAWGHRANASQPCTEPVSYGHPELCYAIHNANGDGRTARGCFNELSAADCPPDSEHCLFCQGDACNGRNYAEQTCERCNSTTAGEDGCSEVTQEVTVFAEKCPLTADGVVEYADRGCFTWNRGGAVRRGCVSEMTAAERAECSDDTFSSCELCVGQDCNTKAAPSSARSVLALVGLTVSMLVACLLLN